MFVYVLDLCKSEAERREASFGTTTPGERDYSYWTWGWMSSRTGLNPVEKTKGLTEVFSVFTPGDCRESIFN
jgi:hypothetical protein